MFRSSKTFRNLPCAHRKWRHPGHCAFVHGYSRSFEVWFGARVRDENGFVMDFGDLDEVRAWLADAFDHTLLLDADDPLLPEFRALAERGAAKLTVFEDVSVEGSAKYVFDWLAVWTRQRTGGRVHLVSVECRENDKNSAIYFGAGEGGEVREGRREEAAGAS